MLRDYQNISPTIHETAYVDESAIVIGKVTIGRDSAVWPCSVARGDVNPIYIGERTNIQDGCILHVTSESDFTPKDYPLNIGSNVTVGHGAVLHGCTLEDLCLIGMHATVLDGAKVEHHTIVAANALVSPGKCVESGFLWAGIPAKKMRPLTDQELAYLEYSAQSYVDLKNEYLYQS